jgi:sulfur carrier protein ThiS
MKVQIMCRDHEFEPGTTFGKVAELVRERFKDEPMIKSIKAKTGKDHIVFVLNGCIIREPEFGSTPLSEGDDIRWVHPYFGG